nr:transcriptional regulator [Aphanothece hegewaldii]
MTLTFNSEKYQELLQQYQPKLIKTEEENEKALALVEELMHRVNRSSEENALYELLITLIEKFEQNYYLPTKNTNSHSMLLFLMEEQDINPIDLINVLGSLEIVNKILNLQQEMTRTQAKALGKFFNVDLPCVHLNTGLTRRSPDPPASPTHCTISDNRHRGLNSH